MHVIRCDAGCGRETSHDQMRGWVSFAHFAPALWDDEDADEVNVTYDVCSPGCGVRLMELLSIGVGDAST